MNALRFLKSHPLAIRAHFERVLVLTYALPVDCLQPLMGPGLLVDSFDGHGFLAIAMVQTRRLRPTFAPSRFGKDFFLTGYRIFTRYRTRSGKVLRGLRILRSDADSDAMVRWGNRLTHYGYRKADVDCFTDGCHLDINVHSSDHRADLHVRADLSSPAESLPPGSPFPNLQVARRFAGPLPFTFTYESETHSILRVEGVRDRWDPMPVRVEVARNTFLEQEPFVTARPVLASAFYLADVPYRWKRGVRERLR